MKRCHGSMTTLGRAWGLALGATLGLAGLAGLTSCQNTVGGLSPSATLPETEASLSRFVRRLHLDLSGAPPSPALQTAGVARLQKEGNTPKVRGAMAGDLLSKPEFGRIFVSELEGRAFAGQGRQGAFQLVCSIFRIGDPACAPCSRQVEDFCEACACPSLGQLRLERERLSNTPDDLAEGASTVEVERRYAASRVYRTLHGAPEAVAGAVFRDFLARSPEPDEVRSGAAMVTGPLLSTRAPTGLLFHRLGSTYADLIDIVFASEAFRESLVERLFLRYLGRRPTDKERGHFAGRADLLSQDKDKLDGRPLLLSIVSSQEYFAQ